MLSFYAQGHLIVRNHVLESLRHHYLYCPLGIPSSRNENAGTFEDYYIFINFT